MILMTIGQGRNEINTKVEKFHIILHLYFYIARMAIEVGYSIRCFIKYQDAYKNIVLSTGCRVLDDFQN